MNLLKKWGYIPMPEIAPAPGDVPARVIEEHRSQYRIITEEGECIAQVRGKLRESGIMPLVGDFLLVRLLENESKAVIQEVLPRQNILRRAAERKIESLAANIDTVYIVTSLNRDFNEKRIDRYLTIVNESKAKPILILTKNDLDSAKAIDLSTIKKRFQGVAIFSISVLSGSGMKEFSESLEPGKTSLFIGSSGVGKSTLVNFLLGREEMATKEIREDDDRGRHTTTSRRLMMLKNGAMVIDTPGLREIQLTSDQESGLAESFPAIDELALQCKFVNCRHESEPHCAVKAAVTNGEIEQSAYESFLKIQKETAFQQRKTNKAAAAEEKKKWKSLSKSIRTSKRRSDE